MDSSPIICRILGKKRNSISPSPSSGTSEGEGGVVKRKERTLARSWTFSTGSSLVAHSHASTHSRDLSSGNGGEGVERKFRKKSCLCCSFFLCLLTIMSALGVFLCVWSFLYFRYRESYYHSQQKFICRNSTRKLVVDAIARDMRVVQGLKAFFYGSKFVDFSEFSSFSFDIHQEDAFVKAMMFLYAVPERQEYAYRSAIFEKFSFLEEETAATLNSTSLSFSEGYAFVTSYVVSPSLSERELLGRTWNSRGLKTMFENNKELSIILENERYLAIFSPIIKDTNLNESFVCDLCQNGFVLVLVDIQNLIENALAPFTPNFHFHPYYKQKGPEDGDEEEEHLMKSLTNCSKPQISHVGDDDHSFEIALGQGSSAGDVDLIISFEIDEMSSVYGVYKWAVSILPGLVVVVCVIITFNSCRQRFSALKLSFQLEKFRIVVNAIEVLDVFENASLEWIQKKTNPSKIDTQLISIIEKTKEYVQYLPRTLIARIRRGGGGGDCGGNAADSNDSGFSISGNESNNDDKRSVMIPEGVFVLRKIVAVSISISNKQELLDSGQITGADLANKHSKYVEILMDVFTKSCQGDLLSICGWNVIFTWNAVSRKLQAVDSAADGVHSLLTKQFPSLQGLDLIMSISCGNCRVGSTHVQSYKFVKFTIFGDPLRRAEKLRDLNLNYQSKVIIDERVFNKIQYQAKVKLLDHILFSHAQDGHSMKPFKIFELISYEKKRVNEEWMYQIERLGEDDATSVEMKAWDFFLNGMYTKAHLVIGNFLKSKSRNNEVVVVGAGVATENKEKRCSHFDHLVRVMTRHEKETQNKINYVNVLS